MTENEHDTWNQVRQYYYDKFGTAPELVDIASVFDILKMCASGSSNLAIANFLDESEMGVSELIDAHLGFMGWKTDLMFSPLKYYKDWGKPDIEKFKDEMVIRFGEMFNLDIIHMYNAASTVERLERLIDEKWI